MCGACGAEILSPHDFGAARMLVEGGVDRFALPERVRALPRQQHVELSARFDAQWSALQVRVEEARWVDRFLLTRRLAAEVEDLLIARVPLAADDLCQLTSGPRPPFAGDEPLREIADHSPLVLTRELAAIALVHARRATRRDQGRARAALVHGDGVAADEAALALGRWWVWGLDGDCLRALGERGRALLADARLAPWAAVSAARAERSDERPAELEPGLRAALESRDEHLRFAAALALPDEPTLLSARNAADPDMRSAALRALAASGSDTIAGDLAGGSDEVRREIVRGLSPPLGRRRLEAFLAALASSGPELRRELVGFLRSRRFAAVDADERELLGRWMDRERGLPLSLVLELLAWATEPIGDHPRDDAEIQPFVWAATAALAAASAEHRARACSEQAFELGRWLFAVPAAQAGPVLDAWARDPESATALVMHVITLHARLHGWGRVPDDRALELFFELLDRAPVDEVVAESVARALAAERGASGLDAIAAGLWQRFVAAPDRRRAIAIAGEPLRDHIKDLRRGEGESGALSPARDPARFFAVMADADPRDAPALASEAVEASGDCPAAPLVGAVLAHVEPELTGRPCTALWTLASVASPVSNGFRAEPDDPARAESVAALRRGWARISPRLWGLAPVDDKEARYQHLVEQIETELRLIAEREEQLVAQRRREAERREAERRAAQQVATAQRQLEEAERIAARRDPAAEDGSDREPDPAWREPLLPDQPLPTIADYAGFLRALRAAGADACSLMAEYGMTPASWTECARAWSELLASRPDLAVLLSRLLAGPDRV